MRKHLFAIILILTTCLAWAFAWPHLPDTIATHFSGGKADGFSSKVTGMMVMVGIMIGCYIFLNLLVKIDPKKENYSKFPKALTMINNGLLVVLFIGNIDIITNGLGYNLFINRVPELIVGILFLIIGNYLPQCKPNFFVGMRNPWTLSSEEVWRKTHRFSGKVFVALGLFMIVSIVVPANLRSYMMLAMILIAVLLTNGYSYVLYKKEMQS
ncbi:SdpI family protein [Bacillus sp. Xin]|uniref:SdpI family protein n=1 Tax=unclassified Bacillus (in: firmicutes) TaxID=185979 RepID=UPI001574A8BE|nr:MULTISPECIES: SdpI family protein [unclassified Bacillus (in: firmicutes)]MBC6971295.1 SdpI family protein [Bacillus sp. Xin]NSW35784.1 SdpI family protein [Bacillus sp. Xin1]